MTTVALFNGDHVIFGFAFGDSIVMALLAGSWCTDKNTVQMTLAATYLLVGASERKSGAVVVKIRWSFGNSIRHAEPE